MLFWICVGFNVLNAFRETYESTGSLLNLSLALLMSRDLANLALSDLVLVGHTFLAVTVVKASLLLRIRNLVPIYLLQAVWYIGMLISVVVWARFRYVHIRLYALTQRVALDPVRLLCAALDCPNHENPQLPHSQRRNVH